MHTPGSMSLDSISLLLVWTAVAIYALAFIAYAIDLSDRTVNSTDKKYASNKARVAAEEQAAKVELNAPIAKRTRYLWARIAVVLTCLGFLFQLAGAITRGISAERVPWANMYEFALTGTTLIVAVFLVVLTRYDLRFLGAFVIGLVVVFLGAATVAYHVPSEPLVDSLRSIWLVIHVFVASLATAFLAFSFALSVLQLLQAKREKAAVAADVAAKELRKSDPDAVVAPFRGPRALRFLRTLPSSETLESLAYRFATLGFIFWTFTLIAGAIWANDAWGRYWAFDTKEVWTFIVWVLYAGYIHARATRGWRGTRSAWLSIIGFASVIFNYTVVNVFFEGLHAYSGLN